MPQSIYTLVLQQLPIVRTLSTIALLGNRCTVPSLQGRGWGIYVSHIRLPYLAGIMTYQKLPDRKAICVVCILPNLDLEAWVTCNGFRVWL